jgi:hypothetical protein
VVRRSILRYEKTRPRELLHLEFTPQARELVGQGYAATMVATTLAISRSSLYYQKRLRGSRPDRQYDEQIVVACGEKPAYGYRRVA